MGETDSGRIGYPLRMSVGSCQIARRLVCVAVLYLSGAPALEAQETGTPDTGTPDTGRPDAEAAGAIRIEVPAQAPREELPAGASSIAATEEEPGGAAAAARASAPGDPAVPEDVAGPPPAAIVEESGLASRVLREGRGERRPNLASKVRAHYAGWTTEGDQIENTFARDEPPFLAVSEVIDGWREGLQLMVEGEKRRFWVPGPLAFEGRATMPQGMIVFDVELVEIIDPPKTPQHLTAPPPDAVRHNKKGLASIVLEEGHDVLLPRAESFVTVHYTGWSTDGTIIDSSVLRGDPATFKLTNVIKGWREGLQLMVAGEKRRFWIPEKLAYKGDKTKPQGMLIFDIELIAIPRY